MSEADDDLIPDDHPALKPPVQAPAPKAADATLSDDDLLPEAPKPGSSPDNPLDDPALGAGAGKIARASLATTPEMEIKRYAQKFGQPETDFQMHGDKIVRRVPETGTWAYVQPGFWGKDGEGLGARMARKADWVASGAGQAIPATTGALGTAGAALLALPSGPGAVAAGMAGGAATGAAGEVGREKLDRWLAADHETPIDWANVGWQGLQNGLTEPVGWALKGLGNLALRVPGVRQTLAKAGIQTTADVKRLAAQAAAHLKEQNPLNLPVEALAEIRDHLESHWDEIRQITDDAKDLGIDLTLGQRTRSPSLQKAERWAAGTPEGAEQMGVLRRTQNEEQVPGAVNKMLDDVSPWQPNERGDAVTAFREGAVAAKETELAERAALAKPAFKKALDDREDRFWHPDMDELFKRPSVQAGIANARKIAAEEGFDRLTVPTYENGKRVPKNDTVPDWRSWQYIKQGIDSEIEAHTDPVTGKLDTYGGKVVATKKKLMGMLTKANPDWADALLKYGKSSDQVDMILRGGVKKLADMDQPDRLNMVRQIFAGGEGSPLPGEIREMRAAFGKADKLPEWNAGVRGYLQNALDNATKRTNSGETGNVAGKMLGIWNTPNQREVLAAALGDPAKAQRLGRVMEVLHRASSMLPEGSPTGANAEFGKTTGSKIAGAVRNVLHLSTPHGAASMGSGVLEKHLTALAEPAARKRMVEFLLDPGSDQALRQLLANVPSTSTITPQITQRTTLQIARLMAAAGIPLAMPREEKETPPAYASGGAVRPAPVRATPIVPKAEDPSVGKDDDGLKPLLEKLIKTLVSAEKTDKRTQAKLDEVTVALKSTATADAITKLGQQLEKAERTDLKPLENKIETLTGEVAEMSKRIGAERELTHHPDGKIKGSRIVTH